MTDRIRSALPRRARRLRRAEPRPLPHPRPQGSGADPELIEALGAAALAHDVPARDRGHRRRRRSRRPSSARSSSRRRPGGRTRSWFLLNGASGGTTPICLAVRPRAGHAQGPPTGAGGRPAKRPLLASIDGLVLSGLRPAFVAPEIDPELGIAHCVTPDALERGAGRGARRDGGDGRLADLLRRGRARRGARRGRPRARRAARRRRGLGLAPLLPRPAAAGRASRRRRHGPLQHPQDRRQPHPVGDPPPRHRASWSTRACSTAR